MENGKMKENKKNRAEIHPRDLQITSKGVEITGDGAKVFARFITERNPAVIGLFKHLDQKLKPGDIELDPDGRVIVRSEQIQKLAFESIRFGVNPASPKSLGRLVRKTGGRFGPQISPLDSNVDPDEVFLPMKDEQGGWEANLVCRVDDGKGLNMACLEWPENPEEFPTDIPDINCFCGWGSFI